MTLHPDPSICDDVNGRGNFSMSDPVETLGYTALKAIAAKLAINPITGSGWQELADILGFNFEEIIKLENMNCDATTMATNMLKDWLYRRGRGATIGVLEQSLIKLGREDALQELYNRLEAPFNLLIKLIWKGKNDLNLRAEATSDMSLRDAVGAILKTLNLSFEQIEFSGNWENKARDFVGRELVFKVVTESVCSPRQPEVVQLSSSEDPGGTDLPQHAPNDLVPFERRASAGAFTEAGLPETRWVEENQLSNFLTITGSSNSEMENPEFNMGKLDAMKETKRCAWPSPGGALTQVDQVFCSLDVNYGSENNNIPLTSFPTQTASFNDSSVIVGDTRYVTGKTSDSFHGIQPMDVDTTSPKAEHICSFQWKMEEGHSLDEENSLLNGKEKTSTGQKECCSCNQLEGFSGLASCDENIQSDNIEQQTERKVKLPGKELSATATPQEISPLNIPVCANSENIVNSDRLDTTSLNDDVPPFCDITSNTSLDHHDFLSPKAFLPSLDELSFNQTELTVDDQTLVKRSVKKDVKKNCKYCDGFAQHYKAMAKHAAAGSSPRSRSSSDNTTHSDTRTISGNPKLSYSYNAQKLMSDVRQLPDGKDASVVLKDLVVPSLKMEENAAVPQKDRDRDSPPVLPGSNDLRGQRSNSSQNGRNRQIKERKESLTSVEQKCSLPQQTERKVLPPEIGHSATAVSPKLMPERKTATNEPVERKNSDSSGNSNLDIDNQSVFSEVIEDPNLESMYITVLPGWFPLLENNGKKVHAVMKPYLGQDGYYIIRPLEQGKKAITVTHMGQVKNYKIHMREERGSLYFYLYREGYQARSIQALIGYYHNHYLTTRRALASPEGGACDGHMASAPSSGDDSAGASSPFVDDSSDLSASASQPVHSEGCKHIRLRRPVLK